MGKEVILIYNIWIYQNHSAPLSIPPCPYETQSDVKGKLSDISRGFFSIKEYRYTHPCIFYEIVSSAYAGLATIGKPGSSIIQ